MEPIYQPLRVKPLYTAPTTPPRLQPFTSPSLDLDPNLWVKKLQNILSHLRFPKPVTHRQHRGKFNTDYAVPPATSEQKFTQAAQHFVANHLFNLPHAFYIYNNQGKKETIDTLLLGKDSDTWWKAVVNELGRIANGIDN